MRGRNLYKLLMMIGAAMSLIVMGASLALAAHPSIPLYTYEEVAEQMGVPMMPVVLQDMKGFPYSPKQTCGNCHNGALTRNDGQGPILDSNGTAISAPLVSYADMSSDTFHVHMDFQNSVESTDASAQGGKPWTQSLGMAGKW